ncbi:MAG: hypothetical protein WD716_11340 [Fimbriimonadaceae bacterium]
MTYIDEQRFRSLAVQIEQLGITVFHPSESETFILEGDLHLASECETASDNAPCQDLLLTAEGPANLRLGALEFAPSFNPSTDYSYFAAVRNLFSFAEANRDREFVTGIRLPYFSNSAAICKNLKLLDYARNQIARNKMLLTSFRPDFAGSAQYMGSKRSLMPFIIESLSPSMSSDSVVLDVMCGSGAASAAFARQWRTYASDAQAFCCTLAVIQGSGFRRVVASELLAQIEEGYRYHVSLLTDRIRKMIEAEDAVLHLDALTQGASELERFNVDFSNFMKDSELSVLESSSNREKYRTKPRSVPYCLFLNYFAGIFFGVRQAIEVDSLRYAIDIIEDPRLRELAMGALIASVSSVATSYASHFAQPIRVTDRNSTTIIEKRTRSVFHEFSVRLASLAAESESASAHPVTTLDGPWEKALNCFSELEASSDRYVYLDAPYTREEYARYYHVLETLVRYDYPSFSGKGRVPSRDSGERFRSPFFTRSKPRLNNYFIDLIETILTSGATCAWSYTLSGSADVCAVICGLEKRISALSTEVYRTEHKHQGQSGHESKAVTELLTVFKRT